MGHGNTIYNSMSDFPASHVRSYQRQKKSDLCIQILCEYLSRAVEHLHKETAIIRLPSAVLYLRTWNTAMKFALDHSLVIAGHG
jgi:hypothetical protein